MKKADLKKWLIEQKQWQNIVFIGGMIVVFLVAFFFLTEDGKTSLEAGQDSANAQMSEIGGEDGTDNANGINNENGNINGSGDASDSQGGSNPSDESDRNGTSSETTNSSTNGHGNGSSTVIVEPQKDASTQEEYITFPCEIPGYDLEILKIETYEGVYVEDGANRETKDVAAAYIYNKGNTPIEYAEILVGYAEDALTFQVSALPEGKGILVQEKNMKKVPLGDAKSCTATVIPRAAFEMSEHQVSVKDNGDDTITIKNLTNQTIPAIRIFYKYYMEQEAMYLGGIAFSSKVTNLGAGEEVVIQPSHYFSEGCRVIRVSTYETDA